MATINTHNPLFYRDGTTVQSHGEMVTTKELSATLYQCRADVSEYVNQEIFEKYFFDFSVNEDLIDLADQYKLFWSALEKGLFDFAIRDLSVFWKLARTVNNTAGARYGNYMFGKLVALEWEEVFKLMNEIHDTLEDCINTYRCVPSVKRHRGQNAV